ncbi:MAG: tetratricopeptide repeat protein, partial [Thermodesulfobacteriota bacterium]
MEKDFLKIEAKIQTDPYNPLLHIALARAYLEEGDEERARKVIATKRRLPSKDPSVHFEWGRLCEELGMAIQARESYEKAIALSPQNPEYHNRIGMLYYEKGAWEKALKHLQRTISLSSAYPEAKNIIISLYEEMGLKGIANNIKGEKEKSLPAPQTISFELRKEDTSHILNLFQGREMGYARFHLGEGGDLVPIYINSILGFRELLQHLKGEETLGVYPLRSDKTLRFCAIRVGIPWRRLVANIKNSGFLMISEDNI